MAEFHGKSEFGLTIGRSKPVDNGKQESEGESE